MRSNPQSWNCDSRVLKQLSCYSNSIHSAAPSIELEAVRRGNHGRKPAKSNRHPSFKPPCAAPGILTSATIKKEKETANVPVRFHIHPKKPTPAHSTNPTPDTPSSDGKYFSSGTRTLASTAARQFLRTLARLQLDSCRERKKRKILAWRPSSYS